MKRLIFAIVLGIASVLTMTALVSADTSSLTLDSSGDLSASKTSVTVSGTIVCTANDTANVTAILQQTSGQVNTVGSAESGDFICTGQLQNWSATVNVLIGTAFKHGPASALFEASTTDPVTNTLTFSPLFSEGIHIR